MLTVLDDYPIHQTAESLAYPATGDRNFFDRYFFNGFTLNGDLFFGAALGVYPNRGVMDAAFSVVRNGRQYVVRASCRMPVERTHLRVGPISVDVVEPMRVLRVVVGNNGFGLHADLTFQARTPVVQEPRLTRRNGTRLTWDTSRLMQFGGWQGWIAVDGERVELDAQQTSGVRDRSWGVRPLGEDEPGPSTEPPQFYWVWAPMVFPDQCMHFCTMEDATGEPLQVAGALVPFGGSPTAAVEHVQGAGHSIQWRSGTRCASQASITLVPGGDRETVVVTLEPMLTFYLVGLGYLSPDWGHGMWKGARVVDGEVWDLAQMDPMKPTNLYVQHLCKARCGTQEGMAILEHLVIGPHQPSGFNALRDPA